VIVISNLQTSINYLFFDNNILIFPNPVSDRLNIKLLGNEPEKIEIRILSLLGQELMFKKFNSHQLKIFNFSFLNYNKGIYILIIESSGKIISYRIIKN